MATEPGCAFGGDALLEVVAVNELSISMTTRSLSAPPYSFAKDVTVGATVNNRAHILTFCESTTPPGGLCASACSLAARIRTEPSFDSSGDALRKAVTVNGLSILVTASSFRSSKCSVAERIAGGATEPCFDFSGPVLQEVVAGNGLSTPVTASSLSEPK